MDNLSAATEQELIEAPVTGIPGKRTPRNEIELPRTGNLKKEVVVLIDGSGSNTEAAGPDSRTTKQELVIEALPHLVAALEGDDAEAAREQSGGSSAKGGCRAWAFDEPVEFEFEEGEDESDDVRDLGDLNTANVQEKLADFPWRHGRTYIMPAVRAALHAYSSEFGEDKKRAIEMLVITDGKLNDAKEFEAWLEEHAGKHCVVAVAVIGFGPGHDTAVEHYRDIAKKNPYLTVVAVTGVSDAYEMAGDLRLLSGTAA